MSSTRKSKAEASKPDTDRFADLKKAGADGKILVTRKDLDPYGALQHYDTERAVADEVFGAKGKRSRKLTLLGAVEALLSKGVPGDENDVPGTGDRREASRMLALAMIISGWKKPVDRLGIAGFALNKAVFDVEQLEIPPEADRDRKMAVFMTDGVRNAADAMTGWATDWAVNRRGASAERKRNYYNMRKAREEAVAIGKLWYGTGGLAHTFSGVSPVFRDLLACAERYAIALEDGIGYVNETVSPKAEIHGCIRTIRGAARVKAVISVESERTYPAGIPWGTLADSAAVREPFGLELDEFIDMFVRMRYACYTRRTT